MKTFQYTAKRENGALARDVIRAESRKKAEEKLRDEGLTVYSLIEEVADSLGGYGGAEADPGGRRGLFRRKNQARAVRMTDMAIFFRQLAISVNSGLSLREALEGIHEDLDVPALKQVLKDLIEKLYAGVPFSKAVASHPETFSRVAIGMIIAAEESGSLAETLNQLAGYMDSTVKLQRKIKSLMAYPMFVAGFFVLISIVMVTAIVPRFEVIFSDLGAELPALTQAVFRGNRFLLNRFPLLVAVAVTLGAAVVLYGRTAGGRLRIDRMKLKLPIFGICIERYIIARICRCTAIMLNSGVPVATTLRIVSAIGSNAVIETAITQGQARIVSGSTIAEGMEETGVFPTLLLRMLRVGETAGRLPEVLDRVADAYEDQVEAAITTGTALLEPIIITFFGAMVLLLILSIYLPVFSVSMSIR